MTQQRKLNQISCLFAFIVFVSSFYTGTAFAEMVVIVNPATSADSLTAKEVRAIFLKKEDAFPDGTTAIPGDQTDGSAIRDEFSEKVLNKSPNQLSAFWSKRVFSGKGVPPAVIGDDTAMTEWVARTPGSIGYVDAGSVNQSVKVILNIK